MKKLFFLLTAFLTLWSFSACDRNDDPPVEDVIFVGTTVSSSFKTSGEFGLTAIPLDMTGAAILSESVEANVTVASSLGLGASTTVSTINEPSGSPLAVTILLDASSSMNTTDPNRYRVEGAKAFIDRLVSQGITFEAAIADYNGSGATILQEFSSDVLALKNAADQVGASGGTPTYEALDEMLDYLETQKPATAYERIIVLLSDGDPNSLANRDNVCAKAQTLDIPIYSIGLGPASDISSSMSSNAIENMRFLADCSGGAYVGIDPANPASASEVYNNIAIASAQGTIDFDVVLDGDLTSLTSGMIITGTITICNSDECASAPFSFSVP